MGLFPSVNDVLHILPASAADQPEFKARVAESDDSCIWIEIPLQMDTGRYGMFQVDEMLEITFVDGDGMKSHFLTSVIAKRQDGIRMLGLAKPYVDDVVRMQRRSFLRVDASLELAVKQEDGRRSVVRTDDISGGGASFIVGVNHEFQERQTLECWLVLNYRNDEVDHVHFTAEIVRIQPRSEKYIVIMVKFMDISGQEQQKIVRYCFEQQLNARRAD